MAVYFTSVFYSTSSELEPTNSYSYFTNLLESWRTEISFDEYPKPMIGLDLTGFNITFSLIDARLVQIIVAQVINFSRLRFIKTVFVMWAIEHIQGVERLVGFIEGLVLKVVALVTVYLNGAQNFILLA